MNMSMSHRHFVWPRGADARRAVVSEPPRSRRIPRPIAGLVDLYNGAKYQQAVELGRQLVAQAEKDFPAETELLVGALNDLGLAYRGLGRYPEAEPLLKRSLATQQKIYDAGDPEVARMPSIDLRRLVPLAGPLSRGGIELQTGLGYREKDLGPDTSRRPDPERSGHFVFDLDRFAEAESIHRRMLTIREKILGSDDPNTADSLTNLALAYQGQGRFAEAAPLLKRALAMTRRLRARAPPRSTGLNNLAAWYIRIRAVSLEAESLYKRALAIQEKVLGPDHLVTASASSISVRHGVSRARAVMGRPNRCANGRSRSRKGAGGRPSRHRCEDPRSGQIVLPC